MKRCMEFIMGICFLLAVFFLTGPGGIWGRGEGSASGAAAGAGGIVTESGSAGEKETVVVLDAGHGGRDPGKVGAGEIYEKDINLAIVRKLKPLLEEQGVSVILTREGDEGLYQETDSNKKKADLNERCRIIEESGADFVVSIHQNSYNDASVKGSQVFFYKGSEQSRKLAEELQRELNQVTGKEKAATANSSYYMLLHVSCPIVIAECGFLSNPEEAGKLAQEEYQQQMAEALSRGILAYIED